MMTSNDGGDTPGSGELPPDGGDPTPEPESSGTGESDGIEDFESVEESDPTPESESTQPTEDTVADDAEGPLVGEEAEPEDTRKRRWVPAAIIGAVIVLALSAWLFIPRPSAPLALAERLPSEVQMYAELDLDALGSEETSALVDEIIPLYEGLSGETVSTPELGDMIASQLEEGLSEAGLNFEEDIAPWLSSRVAVGVYGIDPEQLSAGSIEDMAAEGDVDAAEEVMSEEIPNIVLIAAGKESAELDEFLVKLDDTIEAEGEVEIETLSIEGNDIRTITDEEGSGAYGRVGSDFVFSFSAIGEDPAALFTETDAPKLGDSEDFQTVIGDVPEGALFQWGVSGDLAAAFTDTTVPWTGGYLSLADGNIELGSTAHVQGEAGPMVELWAGEPIAASHIPSNNSLIFVRPGAIGALMLEGINTFAAETPEVEQQISDFEAQSGFTLDEITALFSTDSAFALGWADGSPTPVASLVGVGDGNPQDIIERLGNQFGMLDESIQQVENGYSMAGMGGLYWRDEAIIAVFGQDVPAEMPEESLVDSEAYSRASELVPGEVVFFLDIDAAVELANNQGSAIGIEVPPALSECNPFHFVASGVETDGDVMRSLTRVDVEAPEGCESGGGDTESTPETTTAAVD